MSTRTKRPDAEALEALRAAKIEPERCGTARTARLSEQERAFYLGIGLKLRLKDRQ
ncbi:MAG: hypothetical protein MSC30_13955 [Gaiellaceae bacterium MAG52_C11]|nr:hypothetical protein [Candidatus Gaiellasilicea maunaloa]